MASPKQAPPPRPRQESQKSAQALPYVRAEWYRDGFRKMLQGMVILGIALILSITLNVVQYLFRPEPPAYGLTPDLRAVRMQPVSEELPADSVRQWTTRVLTQAFSFDFVNFRRQLNDLEPLFTDDGFRGFLQGLQRAKIEQYVKSDNYVVTATVTDVPAIIRKGVSGGRYTWVIRAPLTVSYQNGGTAVQQNLLATVVAVRVPRSQNPSGIAINNIISERR